MLSKHRLKSGGQLEENLRRFKRRFRQQRRGGGEKWNYMGGSDWRRGLEVGTRRVLLRLGRIGDNCERGGETWGRSVRGGGA